jgi:photosystem II stability/assembly factor-like uncharacterized protein
MKNIKVVLIVIFSIITFLSFAQQWQDVTPGGQTIGTYSSSFINYNEGWLCVRDTAQTNPAMLLHTSNACLDWDTCYTFPGGMRFNRIQMIDSLYGYGAGGYGLSIFWRTTDGGRTWQDITDPVLMQNGGPLEQSAAFFFTNADTGFYGALTCLYRTVNAGLSWSPIEIPADGQPATPEINGYRINEIYFSEPTCGWATGDGSCTCALKTTDSGQSWQVAYGTYGGRYITGLHFADCNRGGFLVSTGYTPYLIMTSANFDSTYSHYFDGLPSTPEALCFQNDSVVWVGGWQDGFIQRSTDSGLTFETLNPPGISHEFWGISEIIFFGDSGYAIGNHVYKYVDTLNTAINPKPAAEDKISLYPNPANTNITIEIAAHKPEKVTIELYSPEGKCVLAKTEHLSTGVYQIRLSVKSLRAGIYFVRLNGNHFNSVSKLIIER